MNSFSTATLDRYQFVDISLRVREIVSASKVKNGLVTISVPYVTAAVLIIKDELELLQNWLAFFLKNGDPYIISRLLGPKKVLPVRDGKVILGDRQHMFLVELEGPQKREVTVQVC